MKAIINKTWYNGLVMKGERDYEIICMSNLSKCSRKNC